jgi:hypothetical protein
MSKLIRSLSACGFLLALAVPAAAQGSVRVWELLGVVRNEDGTVIEGATVAIQGQSVRTDKMGFFRLQADRRDTITLAIRRLGYHAISTLLTAAELTGDTLVLTMEPTSQQLAEVTIRARDLRSAMGYGAFEERRALGVGTFITREQIEKRNSGRLSDSFRNLRGVIVTQAGSRGAQVRFSSYQGRNSVRGCSPAIYLDGQWMRGLEIDQIPPNTVAGVELYARLATTPAQFTSGQVDRPCGTIVIWSREPGVP